MNYESDSNYENRIAEAMGSKALILLCGDPVEILIDIEKYSPVVSNKNIQLSPWWDNNMVFMYCMECGKIKFDFDQGNYYYCEYCNSSINRCCEMNKEAIKARNFKFQFYNS